MSKKQGLYLDRAGHLAAKAEFLRRGYNVAEPEVDVGDDIFVVKDEDGTMTRVQVKSALAQFHKRTATYRALFYVSLKQITTARRPELVFVLPVRGADRWVDFVVIDRPTLAALRRQHELGGGPNQDGAVVLRLTFTPTDVTCGG